jgi:peroxiredoxin Q/BCP
MRNKRRKESGSSKKGSSDAIVVLFLIALFAGIGYLVFIVPSLSHDTAMITRAKVGDPAPEFRLPTANGGYISLKEFKGSSLLIFFNEGAACEPCWRQTVELQNSPELTRMRVALVVVTADPVEHLEPIVNQYGIRVPVASDISLDAAAAYNALSGGKHDGQKPTYAFILVGPDGTIEWRYDATNNSGKYISTQQLIVAVNKAQGTS